MRKILAKDMEREIIDHIKNKKEEVVYCVHETPLIIVSNLNEINEEFVKNCGMDVWHSRNKGGTIVAFPGDIDVGIMKHEGWEVGKNVLQQLENKLSKYINGLAINLNDIIVEDKYKIISYASINVGDNYLYTSVHISFNPNADIINKVCSKDMVKLPKGISSYGITTKMIIKMLKEIEF